MKKHLAAFAVLAITLLSKSTYAGVLIEPFLGYNVGTLETKDTSDKTVSNVMSAPTYGLRLGYKVLLFWLAADYVASNGNATPDDSSAKYDYSASTIGATVGVDLILGLRFYAGYGADTTLTQKKTTRDIVFKGTSTKGGIGFSPIPLLSLNLEYSINKFNRVDKVADAGFKDIDTYYKSVDNSMLMASVSIPL